MEHISSVVFGFAETDGHILIVSFAKTYGYVVIMAIIHRNIFAIRVVIPLQKAILSSRWAYWPEIGWPELILPLKANAIRS